MALTATQEEIPPPGPAARTVSNSLWVRVRMPAARRWSLVIRHPDGSLGTITMLWLLSGRWRRSAESADRAWWTVTLGPFVMAVKHEG